ncbi:hypothetical protein ABZP36_002441 [Zizania latifolia]
MDGDGDGDGRADVPAASAEAELSGAVVPSAASDLLSGLSDDLLVHILLRVNRVDSTEAARTCVLSRRWRDLWVQIPSLAFQCFNPDGCARVHAALAARARASVAPDIRSLAVFYYGGDSLPPTASWLCLAPPVLSGELRLKDWQAPMAANELPAGIMERGAFELLCFKKATKISLHLEFLTLMPPPSGAFNALRVLHLKRIRFDGQFILGDSMFPSLLRLLIGKTLGLVDLALSSRSLVWLKLTHLRGLQRINVEAHSLELLGVAHCLRYNLQVASFSMEGLKVLRWRDQFDPILVNFSEMPHLQQLSIFHFTPYGRPGLNPNQDRLRIINHFSRIHHLQLMVPIESDLSDTESKMEGITILPNIEILSLVLSSHGHVIGASVLYLLRMCTGIRELSLTLPEDSEVLNTCPLNCICDRQPNWRAEHILMKFLREAEILNFRGEDHELDLLKLLLRAAPGLRRLRITCHRSFAAWDRLSEDLQSWASQETSVEVSQVTTPLQP